MNLRRKYKHSALEFAKVQKTRELLDELAAEKGEEYRLHCSIIDAIELARTADVARVWHTPNGGKRSPGEASRLSEMGVLAGVPDIIIALYSGRMIFMEVKSRKGQVSKQQRDFMNAMQECGHVTSVVRNLQDALATLVKHGVTRNMRVAA
jgi:hypothetical protein